MSTQKTNAARDLWKSCTTSLTAEFTCHRTFLYGSGANSLSPRIAAISKNPPCVITIPVNVLSKLCFCCPIKSVN